MSKMKTLPGSGRNSDPPVVTKVIDVSAADYMAPAGKMIRGINASTAGLIYLTDLMGVTNPEYINTGWQLCTVCTVIKHHASNTAVPIKVALADMIADTPG